MIEEQKDVLRTLFFALEEGEVIAESRDDWDDMAWTGLQNHDALVKLSIRLTSLPVSELQHAFNYTAFYQVLGSCLPDHLAGLFAPSRVDAYSLGQILYAVLDSDVDEFGAALGQIAVNLDDELDEEVEDSIVQNSEPLQAWFESDQRELFLSGAWESSDSIRGVLKELSES